MKKNTFILAVLISANFWYSCSPWKDYYELPSFTLSNHVNAVIEIPAGTNKKIEYSVESSTFEADKKNGKERVIQFLPYPGNYGFIPSTYSDPQKGGDGDALDVLVLSESVSTGTVLEVIPIAVLNLIDKGETDSKIIAIPSNTTEQIINASTFVDFTKKFPKVKEIIELWFLNYNKDDVAKIEGWGHEKEAVMEIKKNRKK